jgi:hypothetical protein
MGLDHTDPRELHVLAVIQDLDLASREPTGVPGPALPLRSWETNRTALAAAVAGVDPVLQCSSQTVQARGVGFLAVLGPPRGDPILNPIPFLTKSRQCPWHVDILACPPLLQPRLY